MSYGLPRKIRIVFIVQVLLATVAIGIGAWMLGVVAKQAMFRQLLREDATYYWQRRAQDPQMLPPDTRRVRGLLVPSQQVGRTGSTGLLPLATLEPGFHDLTADGWLVWVEDGPGGRLYLMYDRQHAQTLVWWGAVLPVLLTLLAIYLSSWYAYRASRELIVPVNELARQVASWDPRNPDPEALDPDRLGIRSKGETRQLAQALSDMARRVGAHIRREHDFTRDASHELRTPLTVVRVAADMALADPGVSERTRRALRRIARAGADMEGVIESQLLLAREAAASIEVGQVDVAEVVADEMERARDALGPRPLSLRLEVHAEPVLATSERALRVAVGHLLENACQYTEQGEVALSLEADSLTISDTGVGMGSDELMRAFEPFYRANPDASTGPGLGLSIVRRLCERFGWTITLESQPGRGTRAVLGFAGSHAAA